MSIYCLRINLACLFQEISTTK